MAKPLEQTKQELMLVDEFRFRVQQLGRRLGELDVHGIRSSDERVEFWDALIIEVADVGAVLRQIAKLQGGSGRERILRYLQAHIGEIVEGSTLAAVSGILEWARRVRELEEKFGYPIRSSTNDSRLKPGQYRLEGAGRTVDRAEGGPEKASPEDGSLRS